MCTRTSVRDVYGCVYVYVRGRCLEARRRRSVALILRERYAGITPSKPAGCESLDEPRCALWNAPAAIDVSRDAAVHANTRTYTRTHPRAIDNLSFFPRRPAPEPRSVLFLSRRRCAAVSTARAEREVRAQSRATASTLREKLGLI